MCFLCNYIYVIYLCDAKLKIGIISPVSHAVILRKHADLLLTKHYLLYTEERLFMF